MIIYTIRRLRRSGRIQRAWRSARSFVGLFWLPAAEPVKRVVTELGAPVGVATQWDRIAAAVEGGVAKAERVEACQAAAMAHLDGATYALQSLMGDLAELLGQAQAPSRPMLTSGDFRSVPFRRREQIAA